MESHVYVIGEDLDPPYENSYVGVSNDLPRRWYTHSTSTFRVGNTIRKRGWTFFRDMRSIFTGTPEECFAMEAKLRPSPRMGLNEACGGHGGHTSYTPERNKKISDANKGKPKDYIAGSRNHKAKQWVITSPLGVVTKLHGNLATFVKENDLIYGALMRNQGQPVPAPNTSGYGGYRAKSETSLRQRLNTTGWKLECKS